MKLSVEDVVRVQDNKEPDDAELISAANARLDQWKRVSGLHTVEEWVSNYKKHPAGWAALLMIHGIPEVCGRLRSKVENYSIYSALFLSFSVPAVMAPPPHIGEECDEEPSRECDVVRFLFFTALSLSVAAHMLSILLGMAFVDALNEAARDADVYRMFARGQGFKATVKCQRAFQVGMGAALVGMMVAAQHHVGWWVYAFTALLVACVYKVFVPTSELLFRSASIVSYWRKDLGGNPDPSDPYDLKLPVDVFKQHAAYGRKLDADFGVEFSVASDPANKQRRLERSDSGMKNFVKVGLF